MPAAQAQQVENELVARGVKCILNYAPVPIKTPEDVKLRGIDPVLTLQSMTDYLLLQEAHAKTGESK